MKFSILFSLCAWLWLFPATEVTALPIVLELEATVVQGGSPLDGLVSIGDKARIRLEIRTDAENAFPDDRLMAVYPLGLASIQFSVGKFQTRAHWGELLISSIPFVPYDAFLNVRRRNVAHRVDFRPIEDHWLTGFQLLLGGKSLDPLRPESLIMGDDDYASSSLSFHFQNRSLETFSVVARVRRLSVQVPEPTPWRLFASVAGLALGLPGWRRIRAGGTRAELA